MNFSLSANTSGFCSDSHIYYQSLPYNMIFYVYMITLSPLWTYHIKPLEFKYPHAKIVNVVIGLIKKLIELYKVTRGMQYDLFNRLCNA